MGTLSTFSRTLAGVRYLRTVLFLGAQCLLVACAFAWSAHAAGQTIAPSSLSTPLLLPTSVAFDAAGNLYFAETNRHAVRKIDTTGTLTTIAGDGTQGFSGDGGPAGSAQFDSPTGIAVDVGGNLYIADSHNHRVRRVDAVSGVVTTVAGMGIAGFAGDGGLATQARLSLPSALAVDGSGNLFVADVNNHRIRRVASATGMITTVAGAGLQGFSGDGALATAAALDSPDGLAVDATGNLYLADTRNHRVRVIRAGTGVISTLAGIGLAAFSGDNAPSYSGALALPHGVSVDAAGNVYIADTNNHRLRRVSAQGTITTMVGDGTQALVGDGGLAVLASLDTPRGMALSPAGLATLGDTGNQRVRQVQTDGTIVTLAGQGAATVSSALKLSAPQTATYGTGAVTATLVSTTPGTGGITFFESYTGGAGTLGAIPLAGGMATLGTGTMSVGTHTLYATYTGDLLHPATQSATILLTISAAPVVASASSANILYGQAIPALAGTLSGVLPQDAGKVELMLGTSASTLSPAGSYPVNASLTGPSAGNYSLAPLTGAALTIAKAPSTTTLLAASTSAVAGQSLALSLHVASTTSGMPTGSVALLDGGNALATLPLSNTGDARYSSSTLAMGTHVLTAVYAGDGNFLGSTAAAQTIAVGTAVSADFTLAAMGPTSQTVSAGTTATFPFSVQMQGLSSPITLSTSVLPAGVTASFNPAYLPPGGTVTSFTLTVQTPKSTLKALLLRGTAFGVALLLLPWIGTPASRRRLFAAGLSLAVIVTSGCGARVFAVGSASSTGTSYPITVTGTATSPSGSALVHTTVVTVNVE